MQEQILPPEKNLKKQIEHGQIIEREETNFAEVSPNIEIEKKVSESSGSKQQIKIGDIDDLEPMSDEDNSDIFQDWENLFFMS